MSAALIGLVTITACALVVVSQTVWFRNWIRGAVVSQSAEYLNGQLSIGRIDGNLVTGVRLHDVTITMGGEPLVASEDVTLSYNLWQIVTRGVSIDELRMASPRLLLREDGNGWTLVRLFKARAVEPSPDSVRPIRIDRLVLQNGTIRIEPASRDGAMRLPREVRELSLDASLSFASAEFDMSIAELSARAVEPDFAITEASGGLKISNDALEVDDVSVQSEASALAIDGIVQRYQSADRVMDLHARSDRLSLPELSRLVPGLSQAPIDMAFDATVQGPLERMGVKLDLTSTAGGLEGAFTVDVVEPQQGVSGTLSVANLNLAALTSDAEMRSNISGNATVDLRTDGPDHSLTAWSGSLTTSLRGNGAGYAVEQLDLEARIAQAVATIDASALAYGARVTTAGRLTFPRADEQFVNFDLGGAARRVNLRAVPLPDPRARVQTSLNLTYRTSGRQAWGDGASGRSAATADLEFEESTVPGATVLRGTHARVERTGNAVSYDADATVDDLNLRAIGQAFDIEALSEERARTAIDGRVRVTGRGLALETLSADASGTISEASAFGGQIRDLSFTAAIAGNNADLKASGTFAGIDPAILANRPDAQGYLDGVVAVDANATGISAGVTSDNVTGTTQLTLDSASVGEVVLNRATLQADYRARAAFVRELDVVGPDANLKASGTVVLDEQGQSQFTFHVDSPRVETVGRIFGVPVSGIARADGTLTGNRAELRATGTFEGDNLAYEENGALTLRSRFDVRIPNLTFEETTGTADSQATFVHVAGQDVNELAAKTRYEDKRITFTLTARQPQRQLDASGALVLHPDHQELHLEQLALEAANQTWRIPQGTAATVDYGSGVLNVSGLRLVSGDQEVRLDGRTGVSDAIQVSVTNVDLASLEALLLREPRLSGRVNASGAVSGTTDAPVVVGDFSVANGGFRDFKYESLGGHVDLKGAGATVDARLQQSGTQWITARGYVPLALMTGATGEDDSGGAHAVPGTDADRLDLAIDSSPLGLGLVQGLTTELTNVTGTFEAHVRLTGSATDPHPQGTITIADGKMTLPSSGVTYTNIAGRMELLNDRVHIDQITVLDDDQSALSITGDLAMHAREVGDVRLWLNAEDFRVLDNELGDLRLYAAIEVAGDLRTPLVRGDAGVSIGRLEVDEIMAAAGVSAYRVDRPVAAGPSNRPPATEPPNGWYDGLRMDLRVGIPDDLIVRANNLQTPGATIGLGALNVTLGGDLTARKDPGGAMRLMGQINTVRGTYDFQGRRFEILRDGAIRFDGGDQLTPLLDIRARREIQGVEALVAIHGTVDAPEILLSSSPPLEQADIFSLIVFNQPINQLGEGDQLSLAARAQSIAAGAVAGQLAQSIGQALSVDTFEIAVAPDTGATAQVTVGQQLSKDLYFKVEQGLGEVATTNLVIEYAFNRWLRLQTNVMEGGSTPQQALFRRRQGSGIDLIVLFDRK